MGCTPPFEAKSEQAETDDQPRSKLLLLKHHFFVAGIVQWFRVSRARAIPKGAWRLQLLSDRPLLPLEDSGGDREGVSDSSPGSEKRASAGDEGGGAGQEGSTTIVPCQERVVYGGVYVPNKYLLFFRWVCWYYFICRIRRLLSPERQCVAQKTVVHHQRLGQPAFFSRLPGASHHRDS